VTVATLVLAEHVLHLNVGIDWAPLHAWLRDSNPNRAGCPPAPPRVS